MDGFIRKGKRRRAKNNTAVDHRPASTDGWFLWMKKGKKGTRLGKVLRKGKKPESKWFKRKKDGGAQLSRSMQGLVRERRTC